MLRRFSLTLVCVVALLVFIVPQSFSQQFDELFDKLEHMFDQRPDIEILPRMLNETFPQGAALLPVEAEDPAVAEQVYGELMRRIGVLVESAETLALDANQPPEVRDAAVRVEAFVQYYETLIQMAAEGAMPLEPPPGGAQAGDVIIIRQFVNPLFITWWRPRPEGPEQIEEKVFTAEIPIWGAAVVVKEVRGVKLELVRGLLPINPCWWWRLFRIQWPWHWYYYRLMPAEFIKTISYVNTWNAADNRPEVIKAVEQDVILDEQLMEFWWFLADPQAAPPRPEDEASPSTKSLSRKAVSWGDLKAARF